MDSRSTKSSAAKTATDLTLKDLEKQTSPKKIVCETDSAISISFDSHFDDGYKSSELTSQSGKKNLSDSRTLPTPTTPQSKSLTLDSGIGKDCFTPLTSESDLYYSQKEDNIEKSTKDVNYELTTEKTKFSLQDIFNQDQDGDNLLHLAVVEAGAEAIFQIICQAPHPDILDICNDLYQTPLHLAALMGKSNVVRRLVVAGATLDIQDLQGNTALHIASRKGDLDCVSQLLSPVTLEEVAGVSSYYSIYPQNCDLAPVINMKNFDGQTSLHFAALGGFKKIVECLCEHGADVDDQDGKSGKTALHLAVENLHAELADILLNACGADADVESYAGQTPLRVAVSLNRRLSKPSNQLRDIVRNLMGRSDEKPEYFSDSDECSCDECDLPHELTACH